MPQILPQILFVSVIAAVIIAIVFPRLDNTALCTISGMLLSLPCFGVGVAFMIYFMNLPKDPSDGGEGPAFFGILVLMTIIPFCLMLLGAVGGLIAIFILTLAGRRFEGDDASSAEDDHR